MFSNPNLIQTMLCVGRQLSPDEAKCSLEMVRKTSELIYKINKEAAIIGVENKQPFVKLPQKPIIEKTQSTLFNYARKTSKTSKMD